MSKRDHDNGQKDASKGVNDPPNSSLLHTLYEIVTPVPSWKESRDDYQAGRDNHKKQTGK